MSQEVVQWLNEIKALQQNIADLEQALFESNASASRWRQLYETEAQQRRHDAEKLQGKVDALQKEIIQLQQDASPSGLQQANGRLVKELEEAKRHHEQTRKDLTTALSDAIDMLSPAKRRLPDVALPDAAD